MLSKLKGWFLTKRSQKRLFELEKRAKALYEIKKMHLLQVHRAENNFNLEKLLVAEINILAGLTGEKPINPGRVHDDLRVYPIKIKELK